jgi:nucleotide-binding universal stress UspA family protein
MAEKMETNTKSGFEVVQAMVGMELSPSDQSMLEYLQFFAEKVPFTAAYFLHALPRFDFFGPDQERRDVEVLSDTLTKRMEDMIRRYFPSHKNLYVEFDLREGDPLEELLADAKNVQADLVVIGQKSGEGHHGILARNFVREVAVNALVVPDVAPRKIEHILVPIDFSTNSIRALQTAVGLRKRLGNQAKISCVHVFDLPNLTAYRSSRTPEQLQEMLKADRTDAFKAFLHTYAPNEKNIEIGLIRRDGPGTANYLFDYAREHQVDLIIQGAKGHSRVERLLLGSVSEKLLTLNREIPTLLVK